jgi:hypothetical protein
VIEEEDWKSVVCCCVGKMCCDDDKKGLNRILEFSLYKSTLDAESIALT